jgi:hypothetical protein
MKRILSAIAIGLLSLMPSFAAAGSSEAGQSIHSAAEVAALSNRVQKDLASRGANIAIVARTGRDPKSLPKGINYTHVAYFVFSRMKRADGTTYDGYRVYNLYQAADNDAQSSLVQDSPADFFAGAYTLDAGIVIPDLRLQKKLLKVIASPVYTKLHNPRYSVLANPRTSQFQNCTEHTLDVLMAALYDTSDTAQIKANIAAHFTPQPIKMGGLKRALAPAASKALTTEDHGNDVSTATFGSIARFMFENDLTDMVYRLTPTQAARF